jgi:hypothetical protein
MPNALLLCFYCTRPIIRHFSEYEKFQLLPTKNKQFLPGQYEYQERNICPIFLDIKKELFRDQCIQIVYTSFKC